MTLLLAVCEGKQFMHAGCCAKLLRHVCSPMMFPDSSPHTTAAGGSSETENEVYYKFVFRLHGRSGSKSDAAGRVLRPGGSQSLCDQARPKHETLALYRVLYFFISSGDCTATYTVQLWL